MIFRLLLSSLLVWGHVATAVGINPYESPRPDPQQITFLNAIEYFESHELADGCALLVLIAGGIALPAASWALGMGDASSGLLLLSWAGALAPGIWNFLRLLSEAEPYLEVLRAGQNNPPPELRGRLEAVLNYLDRPRPR